MAAARVDRASALLAQTLGLPAEHRLAFLLDACGDDAPLFDSVTRLLGAAQSAVETVANTDDRSSPAGATARARHGSVGAVEFRGTARYVPRRRLGAGAFGVVYEVRDQQTDTTVALKTLQQLTSESLYRFKQEFRSLSDTTHRNLVQLFDLVSEGAHWFFTMELVRGQHFDRWLGVQEASREHDSDPGFEAEEDRRRTVPDSARFVSGVRQLAHGLDALHRAGHLHRDIKPSNVLVTDEGRVVIVDFGLVTQFGAGIESSNLLIAGTPAYMSPEQAAGLPLSAATDWYSVGVMLYEALTGELPFTGPVSDLLSDKQRFRAPAVSSRVESTPAWIDELCAALLDRDPARRPGAAAILAALDRVAPTPDEAVIHQPAPRAAAIVRRDEIDAVESAFAAVDAGELRVVAVSGPSGIGKSTFVRACLARLRQQHPDALLLSGKCYERESVPHKALDSLIDAVARHFRTLSAGQIAAVLPRDAAALTQLFPVLRDQVARVPSRVPQPRDPAESRRRAYAGLRELFARLGDRQPLVIFLDDLQWGDLDSAHLLSELVRPPDAPPLLLILAFRDAELDTSTFLKTFLNAELRHGRSFLSLPLEPLGAEEARELVDALLPAASGHADLAGHIVVESGGSPFFIAELVRSIEEGSRTGGTAAPARAEDSDAREASLEQLLRIRLSRLSAPAQRILRLTALHARPVPEGVLSSAAAVDGFQATLGALRAERLLRARQTELGSQYETYHDRIREVVTRSIPATDVVELHRSLAVVLERQPEVDPELLALHLREAGDPTKAAFHSLRAAEAAEATFAFNRAARLYLELEQVPHAPVGRAVLLERLARNLSNAGRCVESARVYLTLADIADDGLAFRTLAAQQFLFGGRVVEGLSVIRSVLDSIGLRFPATRLGTVVALALGRLQVWLRRERFEVRPDVSSGVALRRRVDACWAVAAGLGIVDTMRGATFQTRHLLLALQLGDPARVHRALAMEMAFAAAPGRGAERRVAALDVRASALASQVDTPYARALQLLCRGTSAYLLGQWSVALPLLTDGEHLLAQQCTGVTWELDSARFFTLFCWYQAGRLDLLSARFRELLSDATERGDVYAVTALRGLFAHFVFLAAGDAETALVHAREGVDTWPQDGFHMPQLWELWSLTEIALFMRRGLDAWRTIERSWPALRRSMLLYVQYNAVVMTDLRGRAALLAASQTLDPRQRSRLLADAVRCARRLNRQGAPWAIALGRMLRAQVALAREDSGTAVLLANAAEREFQQCGMPLMEAVAGNFAGAVVGGPEGEGRARSARTWMHANGTAACVLMCQMLAPLTPGSQAAAGSRPGTTPKAEA